MFQLDLRKEWTKQQQRVQRRQGMLQRPYCSKEVGVSWIHFLMHAQTAYIISVATGAWIRRGLKKDCSTWIASVRGWGACGVEASMIKYSSRTFVTNMVPSRFGCDNLSFPRSSVHYHGVLPIWLAVTRHKQCKGEHAHPEVENNRQLFGLIFSATMTVKWQCIGCEKTS